MDSKVWLFDQDTYRLTVEETHYSLKMAYLVIWQSKKEFQGIMNLRKQTE